MFYDLSACVYSIVVQSNGMANPPKGSAYNDVLFYVSIYTLHIAARTPFATAAYFYVYVCVSTIKSIIIVIITIFFFRLNEFPSGVIFHKCHSILYK